MPLVPRLTAIIMDAPNSFAPGVKLMKADLIGLQGTPGPVQPDGPLVPGTDAVLPAEAGDEVAAGVADQGDAQRTDQVEHVLPEAAAVGAGWPGQ